MNWWDILLLDVVAFALFASMSYRLERFFYKQAVTAQEIRAGCRSPRYMKKSIVITLIFGLCVAPVFAQSLVVNGSFESNSILGWRLVSAPSTVEVNSGYGSSDGKYSLNFAYSDEVGAEIEQNLTTIVGRRYKLDFDWKASHGKAQKLEVIVEGAQTELARLVVSGIGQSPFHANSPFQNFSTEFSANSESTRIRFIDRSHDSFQVNQVIDNVRVIQLTNTEGNKTSVPAASPEGTVIDQTTAASVEGNRFIVSNDKNLVLDITTGLVWTRCPIGSIFRDGSCAGIPRLFSRTQALDYLKGSMPGWRIPSTSEAASLVKCESREDNIVIRSSHGDRARTFDKRYGFFVVENDDRFPTACGGGSDRPTGVIDEKAFPKIASSNDTQANLWTSNTFGSKPEFPEYYSFDRYIKGTSPYFRGSYVNCGPGGCWGGSKSSLIAVAHESHLKTDLGFNSQFQMNLGSKIPATKLVWKNGGARFGNARTSLQLDQSPLPLDRQVLAVFSNLVASGGILPALPKLPARADFVLNAVVSSKGEFETKSLYEERLRRETANSEKQGEQNYQQALASYQAELKVREQRASQLASEQASPQYLRGKLVQAWDLLVPASLGNPELTDIRYDADRQVFLATLRSTVGNFTKEISAPVPLDRAEKLKPDLLSGKIAPLVEFEFPSMAVTWTLVENAALRARKFEATNAVAQLEELIREYPDSPEAYAARIRLFKIPKTSKELSKVIERNRSWPEASAAAERLRNLQQDEFRQARSENSSSSYDRFLENFGGVDSARLVDQARKASAIAQARERREAAEWERSRPAREAEARSLNQCRAQVNTCLASCPRFISDAGARTDFPEWSCAKQCNSVNCN